MFWFRQRREAPELLPDNPAQGINARLKFQDGTRQWTEEANVVRLTAHALNQFGYRVRNHRTWLEDPASGFRIQPGLVGVDVQEGNRLHTVTSIQVDHPTLCPQGTFEYQHSVGDGLEATLLSGLTQWVQTDFATLAEAPRAKPQQAMMMEMKFPADDERPERTRRILLGPVAHYVQSPAPPEPQAGEEEHPFCPCCLLTNTFEAFREVIESDDFHGIRFFAARDEDGNAQADCRIDGNDYEPGMQALREYVATWPELGFEFRKQYVVIHTPTG